MKRDRYMYIPQKEKNIKYLKKKSIVIHHEFYNKMFANFIILPYGLYYRKENHTLKSGVVMEFLDGTKVIVQTSIIINVNDPIADVLSLMRYGIPIANLIDVFIANARLEKEAEKQLDEEHVIIVTYIHQS